MNLNGEQLQLKYIPLEQVRFWDENPKRHHIDGLMQSIKRYGFVDPPKFDPSLNEGSGGLVYGNGRSECVKLIKQETPHEAPRGVLLDDKGEWYLPVLFGLDAESEAIAQALALDHNNLTLLGGGYDTYDVAKLWDREGYINLLRTLQAAHQPLVSMNEQDIASYLRVMDSGIEAKEFSEGIAEGVTVEALFKIRVPVDDAEEIETPLKEFLEQFPQARLEKIV